MTQTHAAKPSETGFATLLTSMQTPFAAAPMAEAQIDRFWDIQHSILNEAQTFAMHWFVRRHEAMKTGLETGRAITTGKPGDMRGALTQIADWQKQSARRLTEDSRDWMDMLSRCATHALKTEAAALDQTAKTARKATASAKSEPV